MPAGATEPWLRRSNLNSAMARLRALRGASESRRSSVSSVFSVFSVVENSALRSLTFAPLRVLCVLAVRLRLCCVVICRLRPGAAGSGARSRLEVTGLCRLQATARAIRKGPDSLVRRQVDRGLGRVDRCRGDA